MTLRYKNANFNLLLARLAQLVEQPVYTGKVAGSSPAPRTSIELNAFEQANLEDTGFVKVNLIKVDGSIHFSVKNSGVRILESDYSQFVQPFFTTKSSGTSNHAGMGLTIADCIIQIHGATLSIDPDEVDTTFCFSLKTLTNA